MPEVEAQETTASAPQDLGGLSALIRARGQRGDGRALGVDFGGPVAALAISRGQRRRVLHRTRGDLDYGGLGGRAVGQSVERVICWMRLPEPPNQLVESALATAIARQTGTSQELGPGEHCL